MRQAFIVADQKSQIQKSNQNQNQKNTEYAEKSNRNKAANTDRNITDALIKDKEKMNWLMSLSGTKTSLLLIWTQTFLRRDAKKPKYKDQRQSEELRGKHWGNQVYSKE